jgi:hypothetical protein
MKLGAGSQSWRLIRVFQGVLLLAVAGCTQPALTSAVAVPSSRQAGHGSGSTGITSRPRASIWLR